MQDKEQNISPIKQRILSFVESLPISKREFYQLTGISRGTLESKTSITEDTITKVFAIYPQINPSWLLTGDGYMLKDSFIKIEKPTIAEEPIVKYGDNSMIKIAQLQEQIIKLQAQRIEDVEVIARLKSELDQCRSKFSHSALTPTTGI